MIRSAVIVPCFNDAKTLPEAVDSVRREPEAELVVVDDGSTDPSCLTLLSELEAGGVNVIYQTNQGPSAASMTGLAATSAPYVMRLDADDVLEPQALTTLSQALDADPRVGIAWGDVQTFGLTTFRIPAPPSLDPWLLTFTNCVPGTGCLLRRSALVDGGGWQLRDGWEDWDLWLSLAERGWKGVHVADVAVRYRRDVGGRHLDSLSASETHYESLRARHQELFARRAELRRRSDAPRPVKLLVPLVESLPGLPRLARIQLCELVTRLFWGGGVRATAIMLRQAIVWRHRNRTMRS